MPSLTENRNLWDGSHDWSHSGDEWSNLWGSTETLWAGYLFPRIRAFVPAPTILQIAPGKAVIPGLGRRLWP
jgi:hypothetical protein